MSIPSTAPESMPEKNLFIDTAAKLPKTMAPVDWRTKLSYSFQLTKPITWFAPMWAFMCGAIAVGMDWSSFSNVAKLALGIFLSGPVLCGLSQVLNDWYDRDVDAINEPQRLIPSGKVSRTQVWVTVLVLAGLGTVIPLVMGQLVVLFTALGFFLAIVYSVHPIRAKRNGWIGNALVAIAYEGLPWLAGSATFGVGGSSNWSSITVLSLAAAAFFSFGSHGIMTVNDFKSVKGDIMMGIHTIPVMYGVRTAGWIAMTFMNIAQLAAVILLVVNGKWLNAGIVLVLIIAQLPLQRIFLKSPKEKAVWYNVTGINLYVYAMLFTAIGLGVN